MLAAGQAATAGQHDDALALLERIITRAEARGATLYAACARLRHDTPHQGHPDAETMDYFRAEGIPAPARAARIYLPGFDAAPRRITHEHA